MLKRYEELDSLRGLAALIVVLYHFQMVLPEHGSFLKLVHPTPLRLLVAGNESVILFFILSGFVLSLPFLQNKRMEYTPFLVKRICRIYIPYVAAIGSAMILCLLFSNGGIKDLSPWFNLQWTSKPDVALILNHFFLIGNYNVYSYDVVLWSLIHEMRISVLFPLLVLMVGKLNWKVTLIIGIMLGLLGGAVHLVFKDPYQSFYKTLPYVLMFLVGLLLAKHRKPISDQYAKLKPSQKTFLLIVGVLAYTYAFLLKNQILVNWTVTLGATIIIVTALFSKRTSSALLIRPLKFMGKISYSLYLFHIPVLLSFIYILYGKIPLGTIFIITFVVSLAVSTVAYYFIEQPSMKLGRSLASKVSTGNVLRTEAADQIKQNV